MRICLITQKETLREGKMNCLVKTCEEDPEIFVSKLQEKHCFQYQLLLHCSHENSFFEKLMNFCDSFKTSYGVDWYQFSSKSLGELLTLFFQNTEAVFNFPLISDFYNCEMYTFLSCSDGVCIVNTKREDVNLDKEEIHPLDICMAEGTFKNLGKKDKSVSKSKRKSKDQGFKIKAGKTVIYLNEFKDFIESKCEKGDEASTSLTDLANKAAEYLVKHHKSLKPEDLITKEIRDKIKSAFFKLGFKKGDDDTLVGIKFN